MNNILTAIKAIVENPVMKVTGKSNNLIQNRANQMGAALEDYVKYAFANCFDQDERSANEICEKVFSYEGNNTNPPDLMLRDGDAIEIKKLESERNTQIQLNSSYPKNKLYKDNPKLCSTCRDCEAWDVKDMLYVVGVCNQGKLQSMFFVYGDLYCDSKEIYEKVENIVKDGLRNIEDVEFAETKELARVNNIDHLGITDLRVRGMWLIKSPYHLFDYLTAEIRNYNFKLVALIPEGKYNSFDNVEEFEVFCKANNVGISDEKIKNPQNPVKLIKSKLITYYR